MSLQEKMTAIADAIRLKTGKTDTLTLDAMASEIAGIEAGGDTDALITSFADGSISGKLVIPNGCKQIRQYAFRLCTKITELELPEGLTLIDQNGFASCTGIKTVTLPASLEQLQASAFGYCMALEEVTFLGTPTTLAYAFTGSAAIKTINVPWAEGAIANAPWGAINATINYNYTGG